MAERSNTMKRVGKRPQGKRSLVLAVALLLLGTLALPLVGYLVTGVDTLQAVAAQADPETNPRSDLWRQARESQAGVTTVAGPEAGVLIQNGGQNWRQVRQGPVSTYGAIGLGLVVLLIVIFQAVVGRARLEKRTGKTILRWPMIDRILHWYVAILFIILAITGISLLYGKAILIPVLGKEGFAAFAALAKPVHNYLALFFSAGTLILLLMWLGQNIPAAGDLKWILSGGGYFGGEHRPAGFVNAGEKLWFWILFFGSVAMIGSGLFLLFPNMDFSRETLQLANIVHGISSLVLIAGAIGHIYLGTVGNEGTLEGMITGEVDEQWARQHHSAWYDQVRSKNAGGGGAAQPRPAAPER